MTNAGAKQPGEKSTLYCPDCEEEQTFEWAVWSGVEYFGYPPEQEYGWKCSVCGSKFRQPPN